MSKWQNFKCRIGLHKHGKAIWKKKVTLIDDSQAMAYIYKCKYCGKELGEITNEDRRGTRSASFLRDMFGESE